MYIWMLAALIIVMLVWILYQSKKNKKEGLMYNYQPNTFVDDPDDQYTENIRVRECLRRCDREPRCKRLMTDKLNDDATAKCWYKSADTFKGTGMSGRHVFTKIPDLVKAPTYVTKNNLNTTEVTELGELGVLPDECKYWCDTFDSCTHYVTVGNRCFLKGKSTGRTKVEAGATANFKVGVAATGNFQAASGLCEGTNKFGIKPNENTDCDELLNSIEDGPKPATYTSFFDSMVIGGETMLPQYNNSNPEDCRRQCDARPGCIAFVMETSGAKNTECHLKSHLNNIAGAWNWNFQFKAPFGLCNNDPQIKRLDVEGTNCNKQFTFINEGIDYPGNDIFNFGGHNIQTCEKMCKNTSGCNTITFKKDSPINVIGRGSVPVNTGTCFLKTGRGQEREDAAFFSKSYIDYGKCANGKTLKDNEAGTNCPPLCPDGKTTKIGNGNNCPKMCSDGKSIQYGDGSNCNATFTPLIKAWFPGMPAGQPGANIDYFENTTKEDCMAVCKSTPNCGGIEIQDSKCWVHSKDMIKRRNGGESLTKAQMDKINSYLLAPYGLCSDNKIPKVDAAGSNCSMTLLPQIPNTTISGNDMFDYTNSSLNDCFQTCKSTAGCKAFVLNKAGKHCYIKSSDTNQEPSDEDNTYIVAPFGTCNDKTTAKLDSVGSNCSEFTTPTIEPTAAPTIEPTAAPTRGPTKSPIKDVVYPNYQKDLSSGCADNVDVPYCTIPPDDFVPETEDSTIKEDKWEFSKWLRKYFLREKIMGNEN